MLLEAARCNLRISLLRGDTVRARRSFNSLRADFHGLQWLANSVDRLVCATAWPVIGETIFMPRSNETELWQIIKLAALFPSNQDVAGLYLLKESDYKSQHPEYVAMKTLTRKSIKHRRRAIRTAVERRKETLDPYTLATVEKLSESLSGANTIADEWIVFLTIILVSKRGLLQSEIQDTIKTLRMPRGSPDPFWSEGYIDTPVGESAIDLVSRVRGMDRSFIRDLWILWGVHRVDGNSASISKPVDSPSWNQSIWWAPLLSQTAPRADDSISKARDLFYHSIWPDLERAIKSIIS